VVHSKKTKCTETRVYIYRFEGLFQPMHLLVIFGIALLVFGPKGFRNLRKESERGFTASDSHARDKQAPAAREQQTSTSSAERSSTTCV
jgi:Sec-independent protein translocase protein TatA